MALPPNDPAKPIFSRKTPAPTLDAEGHTYSNQVLLLVRARLSFARQSQCSRSVFFGFLAHEINQPLNVIMMANSNLARRLRLIGGDDAALEKTERISKQVKRASSFVQNLRRLSKAAASNSGGGGFLLSETIENTIDLVQGQFTLEDIAIERKIEPGLIAVGSETLLDQVVVNLLTNAHDALVQSKPQNPTIWLSAQMVGTKILVDIRDNAGGIPSDKIDRIFEPFFTTKESGTGLGLALSRQIIASIGGTIDVTNTEVGAQFTLGLQPSGQDSGGSKES